MFLGLVTLTFDLDLWTWPRYLYAWVTCQNSGLYTYLFGQDSETEGRAHTHTDNAKTITPFADAGCNDDKTIFMLVGNKPKVKEVVFDSVVIGESYISSSLNCTNLGAGFHSDMSMRHHVNLVCKSGYYHLRNIARIRKCLTHEALQTVIHALISSRLDYCNTLLAGVPNCVLEKMQYLQNSAARLLSGTRKYDHITPILKSLHWLPVRCRIDFKVLLLTYKALHGKAPEYICYLLCFRETRQSRSASLNLLYVPKTKCVTFGDRAFSVYAPRLWNTLPLSIRVVENVDAFKSEIKTYLFRKYFN